MAGATLGRVGLHGLVPRGLGPRPALALERALGDPFAGALVDAFDVLAEVDPGALWVLRRLDVRLAVPASEPDPAVQSRRVAAAVAVAVARVVAAGPSADAVRFTSPAEFVASYLQARLARHGQSWVFERFSGLAALPVPDALPAAARIAGVDLLDAVAELVASGGWVRLLTTSTPAELARLAGSLRRRAEGAGAPADARAAASAAWAARQALDPAGNPPDPPGARALLELLGDLAAGQRVTPGLVAAVWRVAAPGAAAASPVPGGSAAPPGEPAEPVAGAPAAVPAGVPAPGPDPRPAGPQLFASAGAGAFLLLPDLEELLAGDDRLAADSPAAAAVRAAVLAGALGDRIDADDPAVRLAAGLTRPPEPQVWAACLAGPVTAWADRLGADPVHGWQHREDYRWVAAAASRHPGLGIAAIALLRRFARHLPGFGSARAAHLLPQVVPPGGTVRVDADLVAAALPTGPLQVLLALAGLDTFACRVPWLAARVVVTHEADR